MSLENKKPVSDIENIEHHDLAQAKRVALMGKTTGGDYLNIVLTDEGII